MLAHNLLKNIFFQEYVEAKIIDGIIEGSLKCCDFEFTAHLIEFILEYPNIMVGGTSPETLKAALRRSIDLKEKNTAVVRMN